MEQQQTTEARHEIHRKFITALRLWESNVQTSAQALWVGEELGLGAEALDCLRERAEEAVKRYHYCRAQYLEFCNASGEGEEARND